MTVLLPVMRRCAACAANDKKILALANRNDSV